MRGEKDKDQGYRQQGRGRVSGQRERDPGKERKHV